MKVHKSTKVRVGSGSGSISDVIDVLRDCGLPEHARPTSVTPDWSSTDVDFLLDSAKVFDGGYVMTFEWDDEDA